MAFITNSYLFSRGHSANSKLVLLKLCEIRLERTNSFIGLAVGLQFLLSKIDMNVFCFREDEQSPEQWEHRRVFPTEKDKNVEC